MEVAVVRLARWLGSLQIAVVLLSLFAAVLAVGTVVESWYSDKVAKDLVYRTWWFVLLLFLLGVNIFFAAAKKWPWKKYQTGFLITHVGLLTMVAGGLLTGLGGTDTMLALIATPDTQKQNEYGMPQADRFVTDRESATIQVRYFKDGQEQKPAFPITPGTLPWHSDEYLQPQLHPLLVVLDWLNHPLPRSWRANIDAGAWLEVLNYYPHVRKDKFRPAEKDDREPFPAVKLALTANLPMMKQGNLERWVAGNLRNSASPLMGIASVQMLGRVPDGLLDEFLKAPPAGEEKGQLVVRVGSATQRVSVAKALGQPAQGIGTSGWKVQIDRLEGGAPRDDAHGRGGDQALEFTLISPDGQKSRYALLARLPAKVIAMERAEGRTPAAFQVWYHPADSRLDQTGLRSLLQFAVGPDDRLYYRSFSSVSGQFALDKSGEVKKDDTWVSIWAAAAEWKFRLLEYLPQAVAEPWFIPEDRRAGLEDQKQMLKPAVRCRLHVGNDTKDFWVGRSENGTARVSAGGRHFDVGFNDNRSDLGFEVKLLRAETLTDPGATTKAGYTSWVKLTDPELKVQEDRIITMNQPLEHRGYKFFQSGLDSAGFDEVTLKPVSYSVFTVSRDPGLWLKYIGSTMLALGIACMFYMKAYFFKPRGRSTAGGPAVAGGEGV
jgi:hypothetical protein